MSAGLAASEPQSISSAAVKLNSDSVSSSSTANTGTPDSVADPVSASTVATKRGRGRSIPAPEGGARWTGVYVRLDERK